MDDESAARAAEQFAADMAAFWQEQLGARLLGVYRIGSLAHGGFSRRYSDIDLAVIAEDGLAAGELERARATAVVLAPALGAKLSIFWSDRSFSIGRFPPLDRVDYIDHAAAVIERERVRPERPSLAEIRAYLRGQPLESWRGQAARCAEMETLGPGDHKPYLRAHLYPARFVYSWQSGAMGSNDAAVAFLHENAPPGLDVALIERALRLRQEAGDLDPLLSERGKLPAQFAACARLAGA
jgi:predicted nucleotidyltransferase